MLYVYKGGGGDCIFLDGFCAHILRERSPNLCTFQLEAKYLKDSRKVLMPQFRSLIFLAQIISRSHT